MQEHRRERFSVAVNSEAEHREKSRLKLAFFI